MNEPFKNFCNLRSKDFNVGSKTDFNVILPFENFTENLKAESVLDM